MSDMIWELPKTRECFQTVFCHWQSLRTIGEIELKHLSNVLIKKKIEICFYFIFIASTFKWVYFPQRSYIHYESILWMYIIVPSVHSFNRAQFTIYNEESFEKLLCLMIIKLACEEILHALMILLHQSCSIIPAMSSSKSLQSTVLVTVAWDKSIASVKSIFILFPEFLG